LGARLVLGFRAVSLGTLTLFQGDG
jgi:hypothetical protein